jgi:hypothetical protein
MAFLLGFVLELGLLVVVLGRGLGKRFRRNRLVCFLLHIQFSGMSNNFLA